MSIRSLLLVLLPISSILGVYAFPVYTSIGTIYFYRFLVVFSFCYFLVIVKNKIHINLFNKLIIFFVLLWLALGVLSLLWTPDLISGTQEILSILLWLLLLILLFSVSDDMHRRILTICIGWSVGFLVCVFFAFKEWFTGTYLSSYYIESLPSYFSYKTVLGTLGNPNNFAATIVLSWPFVYIAISYFKNKLIKYFLLTFLLLITPVLIVMSSSRLAILAYLFQLLVLVFLKARNSLVFIRNIIFLFSFLAILYSILPKDLLVFQKVTALLAHGFSGEQSTGYRYNMFLNGFFMVYDSYGVGVGAGGYQAYVSNGVPFSTGDNLSPHSFFMEVLTQYGIIVFTAFVFLYLSLFYKIAKLRARVVSSEKKIELLIYDMLFIVLSGYFFVSFSNSTYMNISVNWMVLATVVFIINLSLCDGILNKRTVK